MLPRDVFARSIEHPKDFTSDRIDIENYFQFSRKSDHSNDYVLSVASRFQLAKHEEMHAYGIFVVKSKNDRYLQLNGEDPNPLRKYVGFYDFFAYCVENCSLENYVTGIRWHPEGGQNAHFHVELNWKGTGTDKQRKKCRRAARMAIYDECFGPVINPGAMSDASLENCISNLESKVANK